MTTLSKIITETDHCLFQHNVFVASEKWRRHNLQAKFGTPSRISDVKRYRDNVVFVEIDSDLFLFERTKSSFRSTT